MSEGEIKAWPVLGMGPYDTPGESLCAFVEDGIVQGDKGLARGVGDGAPCHADLPGWGIEGGEGRVKQHAFPVGIHRLAVAAVSRRVFPGEVGVAGFVLTGFLVKSGWLGRKDGGASNGGNKQSADCEGVVTDLLGGVAEA